MQRNVFILALATCLCIAPGIVHAASSCVAISEQTVRHVDLAKVRSTWLGWMNDVRKEQGLPAYTEDALLDRTAGNWSLFAAKRGFMDHKRYAGSPYYDYAAIEKWFARWGITFKNINHATFTENIGWGVYKCRAKDCTSTMIRAIRTTFDYYLSEKGKKDSAHYRSIMNPNFRIAGVGIAVNQAQGRYYLTVHYATGFTEEPSSLCKN